MEFQGHSKGKQQVQCFQRVYLHEYEEHWLMTKTLGGANVIPNLLQPHS